MQIEAHGNQELVEQFSRRSLGAALVVMMLLGLFAFSVLTGMSPPPSLAALLAIAIAVVVLASQPLCAYATVLFPLASPAALMACATAMIGLGVLLASLLLRDR